MAIQTPEQVSLTDTTDHRSAYTYDSDGLSAAAMLLRRLARPQTYIRGGRQILIDNPRWKRVVDGAVQHTLSERGEDFMVVQVGANDGNRHDPVQSYIKERGARGLLVEPVPLYHNQLRRNYAQNERVQTAQVAIDRQPGTAKMWAVEPNSRLRGSSSMHRDVIEGGAWVTRDRDVSSLLTEITVPTMTLPGLLQAHNVANVDWLVVDTEGHDKVVLDQVTPEFVAETGLKHILWERMHLSHADQHALVDQFHDMGFQTTNFRRDTFATLPPTE